MKYLKVNAVRVKVKIKAVVPSHMPTAKSFTPPKITAAYAVRISPNYSQRLSLIWMNVKAGSESSSLLIKFLTARKVCRLYSTQARGICQDRVKLRKCLCLVDFKKSISFKITTLSNGCKCYWCSLLLTNKIINKI